MDLSSSIFLAPDGRLRAGWRLLLFCLLFVFAMTVVSGVASLLVATESLASNVSVLGGATLVSTWLMMRFVERRPFQDVGLVAARAASEGAWGFACGFILAGSVAVTEWAAGLVSFEASAMDPSGALRSVAFFTALLLTSAAAEEVLFRGYPFQRMIEGIGGWLSVGLSSLVFGAVHAFNPHASAVGVLNTVLAGVLLSLAFLMTRALWLPIGLHFAWNWSLALLGLPVSGLVLMEMPWRAVSDGNRLWLHGGEYGPEGGFITTAALSLGIVYLARKLPKPAAPSAKEGNSV